MSNPPYEQARQTPPSRAPAAGSTKHLQVGTLHSHEEMAQHGSGAHGGVGQHDPHAGEHAGHDEAMFARPFWVSLALTIPVVVYAELFQELFGYTAPRFPGSDWLAPVLASVIYWYCGWVFLTGAMSELRSARPGMMTLVALALTTAYVYSLAITFGVVGGMPFYWELATLVTIMLLGHWLEMRAVGSAQSALKELARLLPDIAERVVDGRTEEVLVADLRPDDLVLVRPGAQVPADGTVEEGKSDVDESMVTGESRPVSKEPGAGVIGGTVNGSGSLRVRVAKTGDETVLAGIMRLVQEAQTSRTRAQALADRAAYWLTLVAVGVALLALVGWTLVRGFDNYTLERAVTTLVSLPARARPGHPAGDRHLDDPLGPPRHLSARPDGPRDGARARRRGLRQNRDADEGRAGPRGHRGSRRLGRGTGDRARGSGGGRQRAHGGSGAGRCRSCARAARSER